MANRYWVNGGSGQWNNTNNWSATSGGASGASVPVSADDVFFNALGNSNCTVAASNTCRSITCSGYTSTLSVTFGTLRVTNGIEFSAGMTFGGSNPIILGGGTLRTNGVTLTGNFQFSSSGTITLLDNCTASNLTINPVTSMTINGFAINVIGALTLSGANQGVPTLGTTVLNINGTGNQSIATSNGTLGLPVNINKASGTLNIPNFNVGYGCVLTYIAGTVVHTGALQTLGSITFNTAGVSWNGLNLANSATHNVTFTSAFTLTGQLLFNNTVVSTTNFIGAGFFTSCGSISYASSNTTTVNLVNDLTTGNFSVSGGASVRTLNGGSVFVNGNLTMLAGVTGNATLIMSGTGTWSGGGTVGIDLIFNTAGTITISGSVVLFGAVGKTLTYTAGTIVPNAVLRLTTNVSLDCDGMIWGTVRSQSPNLIITLLSNLRMNTLQLLVSATVTFNNNNLFTSNIDIGIYVGGNINGTTIITLDGTGTILASHTTGRINSPLVFDTLGTITTTGNINIANLTYNQGTLLHINSNIGILGTITSNAVGLHFQTLTIQGTSTFSGIGGFVVHTLISATGTHTYQSGATYTILSLLQLLGTAASPIVMCSSTLGSRSNFILVHGATQTVAYVNPKDIDSTGGDRVWDWQGVLDNTVNWNVLTAPAKKARTFV